MDPETGIVTDSAYRLPQNPKIKKELQKHSAENLKRAEERENKRLNEPGLIDKLLNGIDKVKKLLAGNVAQKAQQQTIKSKRENQK
ncbi:MAG: hypothetical protein IKB10_02240 [Alphaproteobacteria bacterium]|nr:hypothetical protein [Alphaproteobacteria bacterium]